MRRSLLWAAWPLPERCCVRARKVLASITSEPDNQVNKLLKRRLQKLTTQRGALFNIKNLEEYEGPEFTQQFIALLQAT